MVKLKLRNGKLVASQLEEGVALFHPVPSGCKEVSQNSETTHNMKKTRTENSTTEPLSQTHEPGGRNEMVDAETLEVKIENEEELELPPPPLLRLFFVQTDAGTMPTSMLQGYSFAAESVKKALISEFTKGNNLDVEAMVYLANRTFKSMAALGADYTSLYDEVRSLIMYHWQLSEAEKELEGNGRLQEMKAHHSLLADKSDKALKALVSAQISFAETSNRVTPIATQVAETRELLKRLEEELKRGTEELDSWREKCGTLEVSYEAVKSEGQSVANQVEKRKRIVESRRDKAMHDIKRTKASLLSLCELNNGHS